MSSSGRSGNGSEVGSKCCAGPDNQTDNANRRKRQGSNRGPAQARHTILPRKCDHSHRQTMISDFPGKFRERGHTDLPTLSQLAAKRRQNQVRQLSPLPCARCSGLFGGSERPRKKPVTPKALTAMPNANPIHCNISAIRIPACSQYVGRGATAIGSSSGRPPLATAAYRASYQTSGIKRYRTLFWYST